jgi:hypothetical protein
MNILSLTTLSCFLLRQWRLLLLPLSFICLSSASAWADTCSITPEQLQDHFSVTMSQSAGACDLTVKLGDATTAIMACKTDQESLQAAWRHLDQLAVQKAEELEAKYFVCIGHDGDIASQESYGLHSTIKGAVAVRAPRLGELYALEYALARSSPSQLVGNPQQARGIHIVFLSERRLSGVIAEWGIDRDNTPAIFIEPNYDRTKKGKHLELVLIHELAHNAEVQMGMDPQAPESWKLARQFGWLPFANRRTGEKGWLFSSGEGQNALYKWNNYCHYWIRCNHDGRAQVQDSGFCRGEADGCYLTTTQMMHLAKVPPSTDYFINPAEMFAEALMLFRADKSHRQQLLAINASLYQLVKEEDQMEIDRVYGSAALVRNVDGLLVADGADTRSEITKLETRAIASGTMGTTDSNVSSLPSALASNMQ